MSELISDLHLSRSQATVLDNENVQRFTTFMRAKCSQALGKACGLEVTASQTDQTACVSCAGCAAPAAHSLSARELPNFANALILNSDLVEEPDPSVNLSQLKMVEALDSAINEEHRGAVMLGRAATVIEPTGYVRVLADSRILFPVTNLECQGGSIDPGVPVLIDFPA
ncbi:MAG: hypothetical protein QG553_226 [Patescibacteria group bacterium]|nr:hypothetical protein [Patescibacteria group bacterium]